MPSKNLSFLLSGYKYIVIWGLRQDILVALHTSHFSLHNRNAK